MNDFSTQQIKMFKKLFAHPPVATEFGIPEKFLLQYVLFEALVRLIGKYYRERNTQKKKKKNSNEHTPLNISVVQRSFIHFGVPVADERLSLLLDSELGKRKERSARNLRNGLVHQWKGEDVKEVTDRYEALNSALTGVIDAIKERVERR